MTVLPTVLATALMLFCAAGAPRDDDDGGDRDQLGTTAPQPVHPGDWAMPELVPNGPTATPDPTALTSQSLAEDATADPGGTHTTITLTAAARGVPARLLAAYKEAADRLAEDEPGCHLPWELLAAIGKVESGHAAGRPIAADGTVTRRIVGPPLNGAAGTALIRDSDRGALDDDTTYDHAVGPMQFIPTTWRTAGRDGNGDGRKDPHNIYDATLAAGYYLCAHGRDLADAGQLRAAILAYNPSDAYVRTVLTYLNGYRQGGAAVLPPSTPAPGTGSGSGSESGAGSGSPTLDGVPIVAMTPNGQGGAPSSPPGTSPPAATPSPTPTPGCEPLRAADLTVALTDLDPDVAGYEALDLTATRTPWPDVDVTVDTRVDTTTGTAITTSRRTVPAEAASAAPALLARIPGAGLATAELADDSIVLTLTAEPADGACPAVVRLRIRNVHPESFAPPAAPPPPSTPPTTGPPASGPPTSGPPTGTPTTPAGAPPAGTPSTPPPATAPPTTAPPATTTPAIAPPTTAPPAAVPPAADSAAPPGEATPVTTPPAVSAPDGPPPTASP
ncbi:lytic transglycosylase domain-containing protein [Parafrankia discariae]|uniref:lytic transglycosylase domain-containing protein n=1 Tax=Parafrankia discariae TaxID=365528 RepID=UPI0006ACF68F|nr:lytic transglycosylase domain-containing protein [Parafrankia discariae]